MNPSGSTSTPSARSLPTQLVAATPGTPAAGNPNICNTAVGGVGITLANGVDIQRVNAGVTGAGSTTGISGTAITTATIGPNQLVQGNTTGISLTGAAGGNITVGATITGNSATAVNVANRSSGTVTFSGEVTGIGRQRRRHPDQQHRRHHRLHRTDQPQLEAAPASRRSRPVVAGRSPPPTPPTRSPASPAPVSTSMVSRSAPTESPSTPSPAPPAVPPTASC